MRLRDIGDWSAAAAGWALLGALAGCALDERAESVYLRQHEALRALTLSIAGAEAQRPDLVEELYGLEDELNAACAALREAGRRRIAGQEIDGDLEWAVVATMEDCDATAQAVERRLHRPGPETAGDPRADPGFAPAGDLD